MCNVDYSKFIVITNKSLCKGDYIKQLEKVVKLHPYALILREKDLPDSEYMSLANRVMSICDAENVTFFVHHRIEIAKQIQCKNIHLSVHNLVKDTFFEKVSVACHSIEDVRQAESFNATQIVLGTIFETDCKKGLKGKGTGFVKEICEATDLPVFAIGGIKEDNIHKVIEAGAMGGCMMSGFMTM